MSVCGQSGQTEDDSGSEEVTASAAAVRDIYKQKPASKVVRVLTVLAYLLSVSMAAILLSVYYVCVWKSPELPPAPPNDTAPAALRQQADLPPEPANFTGGGDSGISTLVEPDPTNITNALSTETPSNVTNALSNGTPSNITNALSNGTHSNITNALSRGTPTNITDALSNGIVAETTSDFPQDEAEISTDTTFPSDKLNSTYDSDTNSTYNT